MNKTPRFRVYYCPHTRCTPPLFKRGAEFAFREFVLSLHDGVFPKYMIAEVTASPRGMSWIKRTVWTVGPHPANPNKWALYEYNGERERILEIRGSSLIEWKE